MAQNLEGAKVAILMTEGFEQPEFEEPKKALDGAGAQVTVITPSGGSVQAFKHHDKGDTFPVDRRLDDADPADYDALMLPGGVINADQLRMIPGAVSFVKHFVDSGKPIAAICHAPWILIEAGAVKGKTMTSWPSLKTDLKNAGAKWVDEEVHVDRGLVTSRKPGDIPAFNAKMLEEFAEGPHPKGAAKGKQRRPSIGGGAHPGS